MTERLLQPSLNDARGLALESAQARLGRLGLARLLVYHLRRVPASALPVLAEQFHVGGREGWDWVTTEAERRQLILDSIADHRLKGTLAGLRRAGGRAGLSLVRAVTPPAKVYLAPTLTKGERDEFLARYPQLRLYRYRTRGQRLAPGWYCNAAFVGGRHYPTVTDAVLRLGWRAFTRTPAGVEEPITTLVRELVRPQAEAQLELAIRRPGAAGFGTYPTRLLPRAFLVTQDGGGRLFNVALTTPYLDFDESLHQHTARPGLGLIAIRYAVTAERGAAHGAHLGGWVTGYLADNGARDRLYRRFHLFDPAVPLVARGKSQHVGAMKLGMPAYTAELRTALPGRLAPRLTGRFCSGYLAPRAPSRLLTAVDTLRLAAARRDQVWLDTHDRHVATSGGGRLSGNFRAGQIISRST